MKILSSQQTKEADNHTVQNEPILSIDLMERAATLCTKWIIDKFSPTIKLNGKEEKRNFIIFSGPGNNGGDGLAIARLLSDADYKVQTFILSKNLSSDSAVNHQKLIEQGIAEINIIKKEDQFPELTSEDIIIDALLGSGLTRPINGFIAKVLELINNSNAKVISIDIPSGLFCEKHLEAKKKITNSGISILSGLFNKKSANNENDAIINANYTLALETPSLSFFIRETGEYVGKYHIIPLKLDAEFIKTIDCNNYLITIESIRKKLRQRKKFSHKGTFGHALLVSGSYGKMGSAILASKACLRSGIGLLTTHVPKFGYEILQTAIPETMISIDKYNKVTSEVPYISSFAAIGIGPGIGKSNATQSVLKDLISKVNSPMVLDADALNILSENKDYLDKIPPDSILTPHPLEFERLTEPAKDDFERHDILSEFAKKYKIYVVLKGAHSTVACPDGTCYFNSTGNPGMATAGSGDVLTGIILALLAQGYSSKDAAITGVFVHGLSGDIAAKKLGYESMIASDIIENISSAFLKVKS